MAFIVGLDLGKMSDPTAVCVLEVSKAPDPLRPGRTVKHYGCRHLERVPLRTTYPAVVEHVGKLVKTPPLPGCQLAADATGVGVAVLDLLRAARLPCHVWAITITPGNEVLTLPNGAGFHVPKKELATTLLCLSQTGHFKIARNLPERQTLERELVNFSTRITPAGYETFNAREGEHDDLVLAAAMAVWLGERICLDSWTPSPGGRSKNIADTAPPGVWLDGPPMGWW